MFQKKKNGSEWTRGTTESRFYLEKDWLVMSAKLKAFEDAVDKLFSAPSNDVRRQADVWLRQLLGSQEAWGVGLEVLAPTSTSSSDAKNAAASMVANKLKQNSPPITSVQAATLLEKFIPLCRTVGGGKVAHQVAEQLCSSVVRAAILAGGAPGQPVARTMHAAVERLCVRSDLYATLDPLAVLLILECAATELVRLTPPRSPAPVESMGLGGMVGIVRALKCVLAVFVVALAACKRILSRLVSSEVWSVTLFIALLHCLQV